MRNILIALFTFVMIFCSCSNSSYSGDSSNESYSNLKQTTASASDQLAFNENSEESYEQDSDDRTSNSNDNSKQIPGEPKEEETKTKIIKEGSVGITVKDFSVARKGLDELITENKAYIADENERKNRYNIESTIVIRMPSKNFDGFMEKVGDIAAKVNYKKINAQDVTRQYVDIQSRLKIKKEVRIKYESFLKNAKNVEEMLAIEREVRLLTEEIEAKEAELRYLSDKVNFSTITLNITQKLKYQYEDPDYAEPTFIQRVGKGFSSGWSGLLSFFVGLTYLWPLILLGIILFLGIRKPTKRFLTRLFGKK